MHRRLEWLAARDRNGAPAQCRHQPSAATTQPFDPPVAMQPLACIPGPAARLEPSRACSLPTCCAVGGQPVYSLERPEACSCSTRVHTPALTSSGPAVGGGDWAGARWGHGGCTTGLCNSSGLPNSPTAATAARRTPATRPAASSVVQSMCTSCNAPAVPDISQQPRACTLCALHVFPFTHLCCRPPPRPPGACAAEPLAPS